MASAARASGLWGLFKTRSGKFENAGARDRHGNADPGRGEDHDDADTDTDGPDEDQLARLRTLYIGFLQDYMTQTDVVTMQFHALRASGTRARRNLLIATGGLAAINTAAALKLTAFNIATLPNSVPISPASILSAIAALYAGALTVWSSIENLFRRAERATAFREARDLLLDQHRQFTLAWLVEVEPHGTSQQARDNAAALCSRLVEADSALRQKLRRLTEPQSPKPPDNGAKRA